MKQDLKSLAFTENVMEEDGNLFYNSEYAARDKYTEGQKMDREEASEDASLEELKFFGDDEIQPNNTLDYSPDQV